MARDESQKQNRCLFAGINRRQNGSIGEAHGLVPTWNSDQKPKFHKYKDRVRLRCDVAQADSDSRSELTAQESRACAMTAAQVRDVLSRLPRCAGQASDAVSAYTQVKMKRSKIVQTAGTAILDCLDSSIFIPLAKIVGQNSRTCGCNWKEFARIPIGLLWLRQIGEVMMENERGRKFQDGNINF